MGATPGLKLPIPELTETADGPDAFSDLGLAVEGYVYDRTLPTGVTRAPIHHWGSGTNFPTGAALRTGDTYRHTGLGCLMAYNSAAWRQVEMPVVADSTARTALSTTYGTLLHTGFRVRQTDISVTWEWTGTEWAAVTRIFGKAWRVSGFSGNMGDSLRYRASLDASRVQGGVTHSTAGGLYGLVLPFDGFWRVQGVGYASGGSNYYNSFFATRIRAGVGDNDVASSMVNYKGTTNDMTANFGDVVPLKANDRIEMYATMLGSGVGNYWGVNESQGVRLMVEYVGPLNGATPI